MSPNDVAKLIESTQSTIVKIYDGTRPGDKAAWCTQDHKEPEQLTGKEAASLFMDFVEALPPGKYTARYMKPNKGSAERQVGFEIVGDAAVSGSRERQEPGGLAGFTVKQLLEQQEAKFTALLEKLDLQRKLADAEARVAELRADLREASQLPSKARIFLEHAADKIAGSIMEKQSANTAQTLAGVLEALGASHDEPEPETETEDGDISPEGLARLQNSLDRILRVLGEGPTVSLLEKIAALPPHEMREKTALAAKFL